MSADETNGFNTPSQRPSERITQPVVALPGDERDVLLSRIIDGVASADDWRTFRAAAAHDPTIWSELARIQELDQGLCARLRRVVSIADGVELPAGMMGGRLDGAMDDRPLRARLDLVSRWGGWAAAAAILLVWFGGGPAPLPGGEDQPVRMAGLGPSLLLDQAKPNQAFDQYLDAGQQSGQVVGEMPEQIVIETRPMDDGTIEVLYLRQIIERRIIDHAYREVHDESGNAHPVPVELAPMTGRAF